MVVSGAVVSMVQLKLAGVRSTLPTVSIARTWKVWLLAATALYRCGLVQAPNAAPSSLHSNVLPASVAVKLKDAEVLFVSVAGLLVMVVSGAVMSTVQLRLAGVGSTLPAGSIARTRNTGRPAVSAR